MLDEKLREDFPVLSKNPNLIYFDNACTSLKPRIVINSIREYYEEYSVCGGRSAHELSRIVDEKTEAGRKKIAEFLNTKTENIVYTKNCTEAINLVAKTFDFSKRKKVISTVLEHEASILPFRIKALNKEIELVYAKPLPDGSFDLLEYSEIIDRETALVAIHHVNNTLGTKNPIKEIVKIAHDTGAQVLVDGAQSVPHMEVNFERLDIDYMAFSGHKMLGPTGIGALVAKPEHLEAMPVFLVGGGSVVEDNVQNNIVWAKPPNKFEAGVQHYSGIIGLGEAVEYLRKIGLNNIEKHEQELIAYLYKELNDVQNLKVYGPKKLEKRTGIFTFNVRDRAHNKVADMLDKKNIAVRSGMFCAQSAMKYLNACDGAVRASFYLYNTKKEIETFANELKNIAKH